MHQEIISWCEIICHHGTIFMIDFFLFFKLGGICLFFSFTVSTSCIESSWPRFWRCQVLPVFFCFFLVAFCVSCVTLALHRRTEMMASTIEKSLVCVCALFSSSCLMSGLSQMHYLKCRVYNVTKVSQRQPVYWSLTFVHFLSPSGQIIRQWAVNILMNAVTKTHAGGFSLKSFDKNSVVIL